MQSPPAKRLKSVPASSGCYAPLVHRSETIRLLRVFSIYGDKAHFKALSYVWGCDEKSHVISIGNHILPITTSLREALIRLRDRIKWIDAICINQKDDREKEYQIQFMNTIMGEPMVSSFGLDHLPTTLRKFSRCYEKQVAQANLKRKPKELCSICSNVLGSVEYGFATPKMMPNLTN